MANSNAFTLTRVLNAPRELVWKVYTQEEHLAKWFGPKGLKMISTKLDFRPGGIFHYGMQTPDGHEMWGKFIYREIIAPERLVFIVSFSDKNGGTTRHPMAPNWPLETLSDTTFEEVEGAPAKTKLTLNWSAINATPEECRIFDDSHASMNQGHNGTFEQLDEYLKTIQNK